MGWLWLVYGWFMVGLWLVYGWFMVGLWLVYAIEMVSFPIRNGDFHG